MHREGMLRTWSSEDVVEKELVMSSCSRTMNHMVAGWQVCWAGRALGQKGAGGVKGRGARGALARKDVLKLQIGKLESKGMLMLASSRPVCSLSRPPKSAMLKKIKVHLFSSPADGSRQQSW